MQARIQEEYFRKLDAAVQRAYDVLLRHHLRPQRFRIHIRSTGLSNPAETHALTISTADGSVWVTEKSFPFRCLEDIDPFGSDAFSSIVANRAAELVRKVRHAGQRL